MLRTLAAECFGTFALVFAGTGAIVVNDVSGGAVTHVGVALTFGLIVLALAYALGDVSGAHLNPAVTLGFVLARRLHPRWLAPYALSQVAGALLASLALRLLFPDHATLGATVPAGTVEHPVAQSFVLELLLTALLIFVILSVSTGAKEKGITAGTAAGAVIALGALFAGPVCGASMNPARSLAPALVSGRLDHLWVYLTAPPLGAAAALLVCRCVRTEPCCATAAPQEPAR